MSIAKIDPAAFIKSLRYIKITIITRNLTNIRSLFGPFVEYSVSRILFDIYPNKFRIFFSFFYLCNVFLKFKLAIIRHIYDVIFIFKCTKFSAIIIQMLRNRIEFPIRTKDLFKKWHQL